MSDNEHDAKKKFYETLVNILNTCSVRVPVATPGNKMFDIAQTVDRPVFWHPRPSSGTALPSGADHVSAGTNLD